MSFSGFTVAASFAVVDEPLAFECTGATASATASRLTGVLGTTLVVDFTPAAGTACLTSNEGESFNIGVGYSTGPWDFSISYFTGQEEGAVASPGEDENTFFEIAASYTLGPGLRLSLAALDVDFDCELPGPDDDNDGIAVVFGVHAGF